MMTGNHRFDRFARPWVLALLLALASAGAAAQFAGKTLRIKVATHTLNVEVADSEPERQKGLMFRERLGSNDGMLFVFDEPAYQAMWMKNTLIPLSVAFLDANGVILSIHDMQPQTLDSHMSAGPALYAVETNKGWFAERRVKAGDRFTGLPPRKRQGM